MNEYEISTATFSKIVKALDKDSAKDAFEKMFKHAEIIKIELYNWTGDRV